MKDSPSKQAIKDFDAAHKVAIQEYKKFWMNLFQSYGFAVNPRTDYWAIFDMEFGVRKFVCECRPAHYTGVKIFRDGWSGKEKKIMSESGVILWLKKNNLGVPPS